MQVTPSAHSRFDRLPAWQRAATLAATVVAVCIVLLLLAEVGLRIRHQIRYGGFWGVEDTYTLDQASGLRIPIPGGRFGPISINSFGFRGPEITEDKPPGRLRIAFLGGSTTYCAEVSGNEMTWPHLVWKTLHERWPKLDLDYLNAGVPGYTTRTLLPALERRVARFKPDIIVIYEATNDLSANSYRLARDQGVVRARQEEDLGWLERHSLLAFLIHKNLEIMRQQALATSSSGKARLDRAQLDSEFRRDYAKLVEASGKVAKIVVTVTFAPRLRAEQSPEEQKKAAVTSLYYMPYLTIDDLITGFSHYNQVIRDAADADRTLLVGGEDTIPGDAEHYTDSVHFTDAGSVAMAHRVAEGLISSADVRALVASASERNHADVPPSSSSK
jgi:lysophospholipase L1-like esterase